jgi:hypothetical protein
VPAQMSAETLVEIIDVRHVGIGEQRHGAGRLHHIHQDQVLMGHEFDAADKAFGQCRIIQRGEENNERPPPQPQPDEAAHFIVVGVDAARRRSSVASRSRDIRMTGGSSSLISANVPRASATSARTRRINPPIRLSETASAAGYTAPMTDEGRAFSITSCWPMITFPTSARAADRISVRRVVSIMFQAAEKGFFRDLRAPQIRR